jgi:hypothetical protein
MLDALDITEDEAAGLSELAALDLAMARRFAARAQEAEDPEVANRLARSYQRAARSYRQTLALKARLKRDMAQAAQASEAARREAEPHKAKLARRKEQVRATVMRFVEEALEGFQVEPADYLRLDAAVLERLTARARLPDFLLEPLDDIVCAVLSDIDPLLDQVLRAAPFALGGKDDAPPPEPDQGDTS